MAEENINRYIDDQINDTDRYSDFVRALEQSEGDLAKTPYNAMKTAELDVQFSIDPSYGLSRQRYGWYSNGNLFDSSFFSEQTGKIRMETTATTNDIARLRSAFPGQYTSHTIAEPGIGARIPQEHLEYDENDHVSLTHGEISLEIAQWSDTNDSAVTAHGISYERDATYAQIRSEDQNVEFVPQSDWNIDPMDGTGPSGTVLRPERGYVYLFIYSWYGEGSYVLAVQDGRTGETYPIHRYPALTGENPALDAPNLPVHATVENKNTADPLAVVIGGMQFAAHGSANGGSDISRTTEESRITSNSYIGTNVVTTENGVDPYAEPGVPLVSMRRIQSSLRARKGLKFRVNDMFLNAASPCYVFVFDEYDPATALTGATFNPPTSRDTGAETMIETDTQATAYTPSDAVLRGMAYVGTDNKNTQTITGDTTSNVPLEATAVVTAALAPGANATDASPFLLGASERY